MFEAAAKENSHEERQNQLRWQVKLGEDTMTEEARQKILDAREQARKEHQVSQTLLSFVAIVRLLSLERVATLNIGCERQTHQCRNYKTKQNRISRLASFFGKNFVRPQAKLERENESSQTRTHCSFQRTTRDKSAIGKEGVKFDLYQNDLWTVRRAALSRFQQAARKIVVRRRARLRLALLKNACSEWTNADSISSKFLVIAIRYTLVGEDEARMSFVSLSTMKSFDRVRDVFVVAALHTVMPEKPTRGESLLNFDISRIKSVTFPNFVDPHVKDDMVCKPLLRSVALFCNELNSKRQNKI